MAAGPPAMAPKMSQKSLQENVRLQTYPRFCFHQREETRVKGQNLRNGEIDILQVRAVRLTGSRIRLLFGFGMPRKSM
jgi:hypothetical protein